ncbi:MAG: glycosyltransferase [Planctomycetales bacterium]|nr:glycosyltransferase [Planctomycetales bacterium]
MGLPTDGKYLLSFGHVRDGKNLDLAIQALIEAPDWRLIVAGREQSSGQRPVSWYQDMARQLGVHQRCHWFHEFIETDGIWKFFTASDVALLLYSADFHSASGVLSANAQFGLPVIASGGEGPLCQDVNEYAIGRWLGRPSATGVADALAALPQSIDELSARWRRYCVDHTWSQNAQLVLAGLNMSSASGSRRLAERSIAASN